MANRDNLEILNINGTPYNLLNPSYELELQNYQFRLLYQLDYCDRTDNGMEFAFSFSDRGASYQYEDDYYSTSAGFGPLSVDGYILSPCIWCDLGTTKDNSNSIYPYMYNGKYTIDNLTVPFINSKYLILPDVVESRVNVVDIGYNNISDITFEMSGAITNYITIKSSNQLMRWARAYNYSHRNDQLYVVEGTTFKPCTKVSDIQSASIYPRYD